MWIASQFIVVTHFMIILDRTLFLSLLSCDALAIIFTMATSDIVPEQEEPLSIIEKGWKTFHLTQYQGFWIPLKFFTGVLACREHFEACKDDIILNTTPKSGTTWLKALAFTVVNRTRLDFHNHPLLTTTPQNLVPYLALELYADGKIPDLSNLPFPRLFSSHFPYELLPTSIIESNCRIIYLCRDPKDTFVSMWYFLNTLRPEDEAPVPIEEAFELFSRGISPWGPFWEHLLGHWKASMERPERVLFIKYEELKEDPIFHLRRLADFLGCPFSAEEERERLVEKIERLCSFETLKSLEVNQSGRTRLGRHNTVFFRRGVVGDWKNNLTVEMMEKLDQLSQQKLEGFGLTFKDVKK